ncbi:hypothetical protein KN10_2879 [Anoxybacillus flavithermus NBRC 109594]|uniref:Uncharacterized protein n=1 Tax=Anoxybacillus flavithermus NBRC 109594 TaxID=1315967 RepID=R4G247_9BACL|nr:hypothetical protein KN10_2879 [Anoxybacillus flavithermus NBRC 109594]
MIFFLFMNTKTITIKDKIVTMIPVNKIDNERSLPVSFYLYTYMWASG